MRSRIKFRRELQHHRTIQFLANILGPYRRPQIAFVPIRWQPNSTTVPGVENTDHVTNKNVEECHRANNNIIRVNNTRRNSIERRRAEMECARGYGCCVSDVCNGGGNSSVIVVSHPDSCYRFFLII